MGKVQRCPGRESPWRIPETKLAAPSPRKSRSSISCLELNYECSGAACASNGTNHSHFSGGIKDSIHAQRSLTQLLRAFFWNMHVGGRLHNET